MSIVKVEMRGEGSYLDKRNGAVQSAAAIHEAYRFRDCGAAIIAILSTMLFRHWTCANRLILNRNKGANEPGKRKEPSLIATNGRKERLIGGRSGAINRIGAARTLRAQKQLKRARRARPRRTLDSLARPVIRAENVTP